MLTSYTLEIAFEARDGTWIQNIHISTGKTLFLSYACIQREHPRKRSLSYHIKDDVASPSLFDSSPTLQSGLQS